MYVTFSFLPCFVLISAQLEHGIATGGDTGHAQPVWLPLSLGAAQFVRACEKPYPDPFISVWRCNHCAHHFEEQVQQENAMDHVKAVYVGFFLVYSFKVQIETWLYSHLIKIPVTGVDVVADPRKPIFKRREAFRLSLDPAYDCTCKHCSDATPIFKLWEKARLMKHLIKRWVHIYMIPL